MINPFESQILIRLFIAAILGILLGIQREYRKTIEKNIGLAGLRTHVIVTIGSALVTAIGIIAFPSDPIRLAASILTGIGFIGAGTIIASTEKVKGLINATTIWMASALGIAVGLGFYLSAVAAAILSIIILELKRFEKID